jgi:hypothetical protein
VQLLLQPQRNQLQIDDDSSSAPISNVAALGASRNCSHRRAHPARFGDFAAEKQ